jgi:ParB-like chromosome segregation protein Spo0J
MKNVTSLDINLLSPSKANSKIYSKRKVDILANSMHKYGQLEPIVINNKNVIQSGVLRWEAAK